MYSRPAARVLSQASRQAPRRSLQTASVSPRSPRLAQVASANSERAIQVNTQGANSSHAVAGLAGGAAVLGVL